MNSHVSNHAYDMFTYLMPELISAHNDNNIDLYSIDIDAMGGIDIYFINSLKERIWIHCVNEGQPVIVYTSKSKTSGNRLEHPVQESILKYL